MKAPLEALLRRVSRLAEEQFNRRGEIPMLWIFETADGKQHHVVTDGPHPEARDIFAGAMRQVMRERGVVRFAMATEAWQGRPESGLPPSRDPQRKEIVTVMADDGLELLGAAREIVRPHGGKPYLGKLDSIEPQPRDGRLTDLLNDNEGPTRGARGVVRDPEAVKMLDKWASTLGDRFFMVSAMRMELSKAIIEKTEAFPDHKAAYDYVLADCGDRELVWTRPNWTAVVAGGGRLWVIAEVASASKRTVGFGKAMGPSAFEMTN